MHKVGIIFITQDVVFITQGRHFILQIKKLRLRGGQVIYMRSQNGILTPEPKPSTARLDCRVI